MIVVVGAGVAGLAAARQLHKEGAEFLLFEASDRPGGRVRSDVTESGLILDRGFQVILSSYETLLQLAPLKLLRPRYFESGAMLLAPDGRHVLKHPLRHPAAALAAWKSAALPRADKLRLATLAAKVAVTPDEWFFKRLASEKDISACTYLNRHGFSQECWERFLRPFFGGVLLDPALSSSAGLWLYYMKKFVWGRAFVPSRGMQELPRVLAAPLPEERCRCDAPVARLRFSGHRVVAVQLEDGEDFECDAVILATDEPSTARLLVGRSRARPGRKVWTVYFSSKEPLYDERLLVLNGRGGLVAHLAQMTNVAPELAPAGTCLLSATVLHAEGMGDAELAEAVRKELGQLFGGGPELEWEGTVAIDYAVPDQQPGFGGKLVGGSGFENVFLAGDQVTEACLERAVLSGIEAARSALKSITGTR